MLVGVEDREPHTVLVSVEAAVPVFDLEGEPVVVLVTIGVRVPTVPETVCVIRGVELTRGERELVVDDVVEAERRTEAVGLRVTLETVAVVEGVRAGVPV